MPTPIAHAAAVVLLAGSAHAGETPENETRFTLRDGGAVIVPVFVDGQGPYSFLLDTGATGSAVSRVLADQLQLVPVARTEVLTPAGREWRAVARVGRLGAGPKVADRMAVAIAGPRFLPGVGDDVVGVLGQDFLSRWDFTIDYRRRRIVWGGDGREGGTRLDLEPSGGRFLVALPQGDRPPVRLVPDSGAGGLVVFARPGPAPLAMEALPARGEITSSSGARRPVEFRRVRALRVGSLTLRDQVAAVVARPELDPREGDGLLPLHLFARVTFAAGDRALVVHP